MYDIKKEYISDMMYNFSKFKKELNDNILRWQTQDEEREKQRVKIYHKVIKRFKDKYDYDTQFLDNLSLDAYDEIYEMIFDDATVDEIKSYVNSL